MDEKVTKQTDGQLPVKKAEQEIPAVAHNVEQTPDAVWDWGGKPTPIAGAGSEAYQPTTGMGRTTVRKVPTVPTSLPLNEALAIKQQRLDRQKSEFDANLTKAAKIRAAKKLRQDPTLINTVANGEFDYQIKPTDLIKGSADDAFKKQQIIKQGGQPAFEALFNDTVDEEKKSVLKDLDKVKAENIKKLTSRVSDNDFIKLTDLRAAQASVDQTNQQEETVFSSSNPLSGLFNKTMSPVVTPDGRVDPEIKKAALVGSLENPYDIYYNNRQHSPKVADMTVTAQGAVAQKIEDFKTARTKWQQLSDALHDSLRGNIGLPTDNPVVNGLKTVAKYTTSLIDQYGTSDVRGAATIAGWADAVMKFTATPSLADLVSGKSDFASIGGFLDNLELNRKRLDAVIPTIPEFQDKNILDEGAQMLGTFKSASRVGAAFPWAMGAVNSARTARIAEALSAEAKPLNRIQQLFLNGLQSTPVKYASKYVDNFISTNLTASPIIFTDAYMARRAQGDTQEEALKGAGTETLTFAAAMAAGGTIFHTESNLAKDLFGPETQSWIDKKLAKINTGFEKAGIAKPTTLLTKAAKGSAEFTLFDLGTEYQRQREEHEKLIESGQIPKDTPFKVNGEQLFERGKHGALMGLVIGSVGAVKEGNTDPTQITADALARAIKDPNEFKVATQYAIDRGYIDAKQAESYAAFIETIKPYYNKANSTRVVRDGKVVGAVNLPENLKMTLAIKNAKYDQLVEAIDVYSNKSNSYDPKKILELKQEAWKLKDDMDKIANGTYTQGELLDSKALTKMASEYTEGGLKAKQKQAINAHGSYKTETVKLDRFAEDPDVKGYEAVSNNREQADEYFKLKNELETKLRKITDAEKLGKKLSIREQNEKETLQEELAKLNEDNKMFRDYGDIVNFNDAYKLAPILDAEGKIIDGRKRIAAARLRGDTSIEVLRPMNEAEMNEAFNQREENATGLVAPNTEGLNPRQADAVVAARAAYDEAGGGAAGVEAAKGVLEERMATESTEPKTDEFAAEKERIEAERQEELFGNITPLEFETTDTKGRTRKTTVKIKVDEDSFKYSFETTVDGKSSSTNHPKVTKQEFKNSSIYENLDQHSKDFIDELPENAIISLQSIVISTDKNSAAGLGNGNITIGYVSKEEGGRIDDIVLKYQPNKINAKYDTQLEEAKQRFGATEGSNKAQGGFKFTPSPDISTNAQSEVDRIKATKAEEDNGTTLNLDGTPYEGKGIVVPVISINTNTAELTPEMIADFVKKHAGKVSSDKFKVGLYKFKNSDRISIDLNVVVDPAHKDAALAFAKEAKQESIYDLGSGKTDYTGESGKEPVEYSDAEVYEIAKSLERGETPDIAKIKEGLNAKDKPIEELLHRTNPEVANPVLAGTAVKAGNRLFNKPLEAAKEIADAFMRKLGIERKPFEKITKANFRFDNAKLIAKAFQDMKDNPNDPIVKEAYRQLVEQTLAQYNAIIEKGYRVEINNDEPYSSSEEMIEDLRKNKRMKIFSTESGFGDTPITDKQREDNPLLQDSGLKDANGKVLLNNDLFRFVHDFFGHAEMGNSFGYLGEENAWNIHVRMYTGLAKRAMTTETRGQNSWVNFSGVNEEAFKLRDQARKLRAEGKIEEANELSKKVYEMMKFADQKVGLLPEEFSKTYEEVDAERKLTDELRERLGKKSESVKQLIDRQVENVTKALSKLAPGLKVATYSNAKEAAEKTGMPIEELRGSAGWLDTKTNTIHLNLDLIKSNTLYHEGTHPVLNAIAAVQPEAINRLYKQLERIENQRNEGGRYSQEFASQYGSEVRKVEALTEFIADVADGKIEVTQSNFEKVRQLFIDLMRNLGVDLSGKLNSTSDLKALAKQIADSFNKGEALELTPSGDIKTQFQKVKSKEELEKYDGIFSKEKTGIPFLDGLAKDDGYQFFYKGVSGEVVMMSPDEYLKKVRTDITRTNTDEGLYDFKKEAIKEGVDKGDKINMPYLSLDENGKAHKQEGRNRATLARELGEPLIPVFIERDVSFNDKIAKGAEYVAEAENKGFTDKADILNALKAEGLHRDAVRFIDDNFEDIKDLKNIKTQFQKVRLEDGREVEVKDIGADIVDGFYSPIEQRLFETKADKQSANKWLTLIGKGDEAVYTGVRDWLEAKNPQEQVSKSDIQNFMKENRISLVEVVKGGDALTQEDRDDVYNQVNERLSRSNQPEEIVDFVTEKLNKWYDDPTPQNYRTLENSLGEANLSIGDFIEDTKNSNVKYDKYQLAGDKTDYKEVLVTLPQNTKEKQKLESFKSELREKYGSDFKGSQLTDAEIDALQYLKEAATKSKNVFKSSHFDEPNILVHLRMSTRESVDGKKVTLLEENQSDWGQKGKREGFALTEQERSRLIEEHKGVLSELQDINEAIIANVESGNKDKSAYELAQKKIKLQEKSEELKDQIFKNKSPKAPFVTDTNAWTKLGLKYALRHAVETGSERLAWTTGEQQNERYDLSKQVDFIDYRKNEDGTYFIDTNHQSTSRDRLKENELEGFVGKEVANKIIKGEGKTSPMDDNDNRKRLEGLDLKVGGKGMVGFYGSVEQGKEGIIGGVAKALVKELTGKQGEIGETKIFKGTDDLTKKEALELLKSGEKIYTYSRGVIYRLYDEIDINEATNYHSKKGEAESTQLSIEITPELKAAVENGMPLFQKSNRLEDLKQFIEEKRKLGGISEESLRASVETIAKEQGIEGVDALFSEKGSTFGDPKAEYDAAQEGLVSSRAKAEAKLPFIDKYFKSIEAQLMLGNKIKRIC